MNRNLIKILPLVLVIFIFIGARQLTKASRRWSGFRQNCLNNGMVRKRFSQDISSTKSHEGATKLRKGRLASSLVFLCVALWTVFSRTAAQAGAVDVVFFDFVAE